MAAAEAGQYGGPYVQIAAFTEKIIRGAQSGQLSLINMIDGVTAVGPDPDEMPSFSLEHLVVVINLWAGLARGRYALKLRPEAPSGLQGDLLDIGPVNFAGPGVDTIRQMPAYEVTEEGTYWFDVILAVGSEQDGRLLTRIPLTVTYQPQLN